MELRDLKDTMYNLLATNKLQLIERYPMRHPPVPQPALQGQRYRLRLSYVCHNRPAAGVRLTFFCSALLLSSLELSDTNVYEPSIRARLGTAEHLSEVVVLNFPPFGVQDVEHVPKCASCGAARHFEFQVKLVCVCVCVCVPHAGLRDTSSSR